MVKKKIFIAGGAGYIGTRFCNTFCDDYDITVLDYFWFGDNIKSEKVTKIYAGPLLFYRAGQ